MNRGKQVWPRHVVRLVNDRKGAIAVMTAVTLSTLLGVAGLGTEATLWYVAKRNLQGATDTAAFTAATAEAAGQTSSGFSAAAQAVARNYGYVSGTGGVTVTVNNPPQSGPNTGNSQAVEILIQQPQQLMFAALFMHSNPAITARAVAAPGAGAGNGGAANCVVALDKGSVTDVIDSGSATLNMPSCNIMVNSPNADALSLSGTGTIDAKSATIVGNYTTSGSAKLNATNGITTGASAMADPYAGVSIPAYAGCNQTSLHVVAAKTLTPVGGIYVLCNGLSVSGTGNLTLQPGVYIVNGGNLSVSGGATISGTGVTIIMTDTTPSSTGTVSISGGANVNLSAPTTGATAGLAFFQDRGASSAGSNSFSGGSTQSITGALYFPSQAVTFSGNSGNTASPCTQLIGYTLTFSGSSTFNANCNGLGLLGMGGSASAGAVKLLE
jgi:hypothetical protein